MSGEFCGMEGCTCPDPVELSDLEQEQIDRHFQFEELARSWGPSGIYRKVQRYIDTDLAADLARYRDSHDPLYEGSGVCHCRRYWPCSEWVRFREAEAPF